MPGHSLTITPKEKQINKERKGSKIKINTNRKGEQSEVVGGEGRGGLRPLAGCVSLVKSKWECIIWALHRIDPEHSPLHWAFLPAQIEGLPQEEVLWLGTIGIYPLLICGIEEANPWQKADTESEGRWMMPGWGARGVGYSIEKQPGMASSKKIFGKRWKRKNQGWVGGHVWGREKGCLVKFTAKEDERAKKNQIEMQILYSLTETAASVGFYSRTLSREVLQYVCVRNN